MKKLICTVSVLILTVSFLTVVHSQNPSTIVIRSHLTNIEGENVITANINSIVTVVNSDGATCFTSEEAIITNEMGLFEVYLHKIDPIFMEGSKNQPAVIQLSITSPDNEWLEEDKFLVKYLIKTEKAGSDPLYSITRMEGQKLNYESQSGIWMFTDVYPFAYISSTILVSFNSEITDPESLILSAESMFEESLGKNIAEPAMEEAPASRGVKGGFAVGGYKKN